VPRSGPLRLSAGSLARFRHSAVGKGRTLAIFFLVGGTLTLVVLAIPHGHRVDVLPVALLGAAACLTGAALWSLGPRLPDPVLHGLLAFGSALISLGAYFAHGGGLTVAVAFFYTWVGVYASMFFAPVAVRAHLLGCAGAFAAVLVANGQSDGPADWVLAIGTATTAGLVISALTAELSEAQATLIRQERLSAIGEMATVIGHELRNPLGAAVNSLFLVRHKLGEGMDPEVDAHLRRAEGEAHRAAALSEDLTAYMRERPPAIVTLDLAEVVSAVVESTPPPKGITVATPAPGLVVAADRDQLIQVLINLVTNAYQAMPTGGSLTIAGSHADRFSEIMLQDTGPGIDAEVADRLFEPFVSTKANGTGLGLAIVKRIVQAHNGAVSIDHGPSGGARVILRFPTT
jgi:signal transduction histidine kinase